MEESLETMYEMVSIAYTEECKRNAKLKFAFEVLEKETTKLREDNKDLLSVLESYKRIKNTDINKLTKALEFARTTINHALYLGYCGEGSTKGMCEEAVKKANEALGDEE